MRMLQTLNFKLLILIYSVFDIHGSFTTNKDIWDSCTRDEECQEKVLNTICSGHFCRCKYGFVKLNIDCILIPKDIGDICEIDAQCERRDKHSLCSKQCICKPGFQYRGLQCQRGECENDSDCYGIDSKCFKDFSTNEKKCRNKHFSGFDSTEDRTVKIVIGGTIGIFGFMIIFFICAMAKRQIRSIRNRPIEREPDEHVDCHCHNLDKPPSYEDILNMELPPPYSYEIGNGSAAINQGYVNSSIPNLEEAGRSEVTCGSLNQPVAENLSHQNTTDEISTTDQTAEQPTISGTEERTESNRTD